MASKVYFAPQPADKGPESLLGKVKQLFEKAGFQNCISKDDMVAVKLHFGEAGNTTFVQPNYVRRVVDCIKSSGGKPFLTDANTLYFGQRSNSVDHLNIAHKHGFLPDVVDAPVIIADGLTSRDVVEVPVNLKHFQEVKLASAAVHSDALICVTHFKGHIVAGFGGTLKNIGMGFGSRAGKQMMHSDINPTVNEEKCTGCEVCASYCPKSAITIRNGKAFINQKLCYGCAECFTVCTSKAIDIRWDSSAEPLQEKMVEYVYGVLKGKEGKAGFFNFVNNVTTHCDCLSRSDDPFIEDIGILASGDPVAIDQAAADMVNAASLKKESGLEKKSGKDNLMAANDVDWSHQLRYAEEIGLGSRKYDIVEI